MQNNCEKLHKWFSTLSVFHFPFDESNIPLNGIYILFEKGERAHGGSRIVRVGTHTGDKQLVSRLRQHFINENKDRSIFRKNIGRAILSKSKDPFLRYWEIDMTTRDARDRHYSQIDFKKQQKIEKKVSKYIQDNFSFVVLPVDNKNVRLDVESKIISTISLCKECGPSKKWLGLYSPKDKIQKSGLWLVNELYKKPLSKTDFKKLVKQNV